MGRVSRRDFLQVSTGIALGAGIAMGCATTPSGTVTKLSERTVPPGRRTDGETITVGVIGCGGRGQRVMLDFQAHDDVTIGAVCDVYQPHIEEAVRRAEGSPQTYHDFRELLAQPDLDAVIVTTPPHWHAIMSVMACEAGLDVYCEKPMTLTPTEARAMVNAARRFNRVTQIGTQIHAEENYHRCVEIVRSGVLGRLTAVRSSLALNEAPDGLGFPADEAPPADLDWDFWIGPAPEAPFNWARFEHGQHRYFKEYIHSWLNELGPHVVDLPFWALELGPPRSAMATGGKYAINDISTIPDTMEVLWEYPDYVVTWSNMCASSHGMTMHEGTGIRRRNGTAFHGVNGTLLADYGRRDFYSENGRLDEEAIPDPWLPRSPGHVREFLDAIMTRELPSCDMEKHYPLCVALNLGNIALQVGRKVQWDAEREMIIDDPEANALAQPQYRAPWRLPV